MWAGVWPPQRCSKMGRCNANCSMMCHDVFDEFWFCASASMVFPSLEFRKKRRNNCCQFLLWSGSFSLVGQSYAKQLLAGPAALCLWHSRGIDTFQQFATAPAPVRHDCTNKIKQAHIWPEAQRFLCWLIIAGGGCHWKVCAGRWKRRSLSMHSCPKFPTKAVQNKLASGFAYFMLFPKHVHDAFPPTYLHFFQADLFQPWTR